MQWANVCAAAFIIIIPLLVAFFFAQKQFMSSFVSAGIKEKVQDGERQEKENRRRRSDKKDAGKERAWE